MNAPESSSIKSWLDKLRYIALTLSIVLISLLIALTIPKLRNEYNPTPTATFTPTPVSTPTTTVNPTATVVTSIKFWGVDLDEPGYSLDKRLVDQFTMKTDIRVDILPKPRDATEALEQLQKMLEQGNPPDVMALDVIWIGKVAEHLRPLSELEEEAQYHYAELLSNNMIENQLMAMPWFVNFGLLYYRTDLLQKYGYQSPPTTWDQLKEMAAKIQAGERGSNPNFWGFVWQGAEYEGLTCNALEWIASTGGKIVDSEGRIDIDSNATKDALKQAQSWVGVISPPDITSYKENQALEAFQNGNAAFMRNWPTAYTQISTQSVPFGIAPLPSKDGEQSVGTFGGAAIGIARSTQNAQAAIEFVRYMTSQKTEMERASSGSFIPTIPMGGLFEPQDQLPETMVFLENHRNYLVQRPSTVTRQNYDKVSAVIFEGIHNILTGKNVDEVVPQIAEKLQMYIR